MDLQELKMEKNFNEYLKNLEGKNTEGEKISCFLAQCGPLNQAEFEEFLYSLSFGKEFLHCLKHHDVFRWQVPQEILRHSHNGGLHQSCGPKVGESRIQRIRVTKHLNRYCFQVARDRYPKGNEPLNNTASSGTW